MTTSDNQLSGWTEKKPQSTSQSQTCTKKRGHGHCLVVCCLSNPLQLSESQQNHYIWEVCSASMRCTKNCNACSWHWSTERAQFSMAAPSCTSHKPNASKVEWIGLKSFASSAIFTWPLANQLPLLQAFQQLFAGKMLPQPAEGRRCFPRVHRIQKHGFFHYRNKQAYFSLAKKCWL